MNRPAVSTVIVGATRVEQIQQNLQSTPLELDAETLDKLEEASRPFRSGEPFAVYRLP
ncbi:Aldo/keto reductase family protein [compost metagenome]